MNRFRPNFVVGSSSGGGGGGRGGGRGKARQQQQLAPFEEDDWRELRIGGMDLAIVKPCSRCKVTTINQVGERESSG